MRPSLPSHRWLVHCRNALLALLGMSLGWTTACNVGPMEPSSDHHHTHEELSTLRQGMISCQTRKDTGYTSGKAFSITVVTVDGKPVERDTANAYWVMREAARKAGVNIVVVSGFRTMAEQQYLYNCYLSKKCNNGNLAARPGYSNHQSGHALDLNTSVSSVYNWLTANGAKYGFKRTVPSEKWHWEWWSGGPGGGPCQSTCKPACLSKTQIRDAKCGTGDCGAYGANCVDDRLGVRCYSVFCPPLGTKTFCHDGQVGTCKDGAVKFTKCATNTTCHGTTAPKCTPSQKPIGYLDGATCQKIGGWTQDPDHKTTSIDAHIYFNGPAGDKNAKGVSIPANRNRADLCKTIGSCNHGFEALSPLSLHDDKSHPVHVYGIDADKIDNPQLRNSPKSIKCAPQVPAGFVRRHITSQTVLKAWKLDAFWDKLPLPSDQIIALPEESPIPATPTLVRVDGATTLWLIDGDLRRQAPSDWKETWRFDEKTIQTWTQSKLDTYREGPPLHTRMIYVVDATGRASLLDASRPAAPVDPPVEPSQDGGDTPDSPNTEQGHTDSPAQDSPSDAGEIDTSNQPADQDSGNTTPPPQDPTKDKVTELPFPLAPPPGQPEPKGFGCQLGNHRPQDLPTGIFALLCLALLATRSRRS